MLDAKNLKHYPSRKPASVEQSLDATKPSPEWQCVDDLYRSLPENELFGDWLEPAQPADEEVDWWDFLEQAESPGARFE
jgi:hypothetical protein